MHGTAPAADRRRQERQRLLFAQLKSRAGLRELDGERTRCRALLRAAPAGDGCLDVCGFIVSPP